MPINEYFKGNGDKVLSNMVAEYGPKKGKSVFYATANKKKQTPDANMAKDLINALSTRRKKKV